MARTFILPTSTRHQGRVITVARIAEDGAPTAALAYNILDLRPDSANDDDDWTGWRELPTQPQVAPAGMSVLAAAPLVGSAGRVAVVSDAVHVYVFWTEGRTVLCQRYLMLDNPAVGADSQRKILQPAWQVRFQRSQSADVPASPLDTMDFRDLEQRPFVEPVTQLAFGTGDPDLPMDLTGGSFCVVLAPTAAPDALRWQFFLVSRAEDPAARRIYAYSIARSEDGLFAFEGDAIDPETGGIRPDAALSLRAEEGALELAGPPSAAIYFKQEPAVTESGAALMTNQAQRLLLTCQCAIAGPERRLALATLDFGIDGEGRLAEAPAPTVELGPVLPAEYAIALDGRARIRLPGGESGYLPGAAFTLEAWIFLQADSDEPLGVLGGAAGVEPAERPPSVSIVSRLRVEVGFGDGESFRSAVSGDVLVPGAWNHLAFAFDADGGPALYHNGEPVSIEGDLDSDAVPFEAPLTRIGAGDLPLVGRVDEVRAWSVARERGAILDTLYREIGDEEARNDPDLQGYWRLDEGSGIVAGDSAGKGNGGAGYPGALDGAAWLATTAPLIPEASPVTYFDGRGLTLVAGLIVPGAAPGTERFGALAEGEAAALMAGADGLLRAYYRGADDQALVARYDVSTTRAVYSAGWLAGPEQGDGAQRGALSLTMRQAGSPLNRARIVLSTELQGQGLLAQLEVSDTPEGVGPQRIERASGAVTERWRGLVREAGFVRQVLNGQAATEPGDERVRRGETAYYDYAGRAPMAFLAESAGPELAYLQLVSRLAGPFACRGVDVEPGASPQTCDVRIRLASDARHPEETLVRTLPGVPRDAAGFLAVLSGVGDYPYAAAPPEGDTLAFALATSRGGPVGVADPLSQGLQLYAPEPVGDARFEVTSGSAPDLCDLEIALTLAGEPVVDTWEDVPRDAAALAEAIAADPQRAGEALRLLPPEVSGAVLDQRVDAPLGATVFLSFWETLSRGFRGPVPDASLDLEPLQGASSDAVGADLGRGSQLIYATGGDTAGNGYPPLLAVDQGPLPLLRPGVDGGWLAEPPRNAVRFSDAGLDVDTSTGADALSAPDPLTLEAWFRFESEPQMGPIFTGSVAPRICHFNPADDPERARYALGLRVTEAPLLSAGAHISVSDAGVEPSELRLAAGDGYTLQAYVLFNLSFAFGRDPIWTLEFVGEGAEVLSVDPEGALLWRREGDEVVEIAAPEPLVAWRWTLLTVTRDGDEIRISVDGDEVASGQAARLDASERRFTVGGSESPPSLQLRANAVAVWNRARGAAEIAADFQRPPPPDDQDLVLFWPLDEDREEVLNRAESTGDRYDTSIDEGFSLYLQPGVFYRAFAAVRGGAVETRDALIGPDTWHHVSAVYRPRYGAQCDAERWGDCGADDSLNTSNALSIAAWIIPDDPARGLAQALFSRYGDEPQDRAYLLQLDRDGRPSLVVRVEGPTVAGAPAPESALVRSWTAPEPVTAGAASHVAATAEVVSITTSGGETLSAVSPQIYVDGEPGLPGPALPGPTPAAGGAPTYRLDVIDGSGSGRYPAGEQVPVSASSSLRFTRWAVNAGAIANAGAESTTLTMPAEDVTALCTGVSEPLTFTPSSANAAIGRARLGADAPSLNRPYFGLISEVQLWSRALSSEEIARYLALGALSDDREGLISYWRFEEQVGVSAQDDQYGNDAQLTVSDAWRAFYDGAEIQLQIDGRPAIATRTSPVTYGGYGPAQAQIGAMESGSGAPANTFSGAIDELRVWGEARTTEQLSDNMHGYLVGNEPALVGYWRFDVGSGGVVVDRTPQRNDARFPAGEDAPTWVVSTAPVNDEAPQIRNALGGPDTPQVASVRSAPAVAEYGDLQRDSRGALFSVLKRAHAVERAGGAELVTGFRIGDLDVIHLGQIQTQPTLVGYIEGPPPVPGENYTRPFWKDPTKPSFTAYSGSSSVTLTESQALELEVASASQEGNNDLASAALALEVDQSVDTIVGLPPATVIVPITQNKLRLGGEVEFDWGRATGEEGGFGNTVERARVVNMSADGSWERAPDDELSLASGERRFIPCNDGVAVVRSMTADLFSTNLRSTGAVVSLSVVPNPDIPEDTNLIVFPINPRYTKNGTLDGQLGLRTDPDFAAAPPTERSYFRPVEAYSLEQQIRARDAQLESYYAQIDAQTAGSAGQIELDEQRAENPLYDFSAQTPRQDLVIDSVWTAGGGLYTETAGYVNTLRECFQGVQTFQRNVKVFGELSFAIGPVGVGIEGSYQNQFTTTRTLDNKRGEQSAISLEIEADPEGFLGRYLGDELPGYLAYSDAPEPGKVHTYRFKTFYLSPDAAHFERFFDTVVDPEWLQVSQSASAAALREATARRGGGGVWRVMHRVTFVGRVPPSFQVYPSQSDAPPDPEPLRSGQNALVLGLVEARLGGAEPTPAAIGAAVLEVLLEDLEGVLPWWGSLLAAAEAPNSQAALAWERLRDQLTRYAVQAYTTRP